MLRVELRRVELSFPWGRFGEYSGRRLGTTQATRKTIEYSLYRDMDLIFLLRLESNRGGVQGVAAQPAGGG